MINHIDFFIKSTTENDNPVKMINAVGENIYSQPSKMKTSKMINDFLERKNPHKMINHFTG